MQFCVLGPIAVAADGRRDGVGRGHGQTILAVLLAAGGHPVSTSRLVDALWGARAPATARKTLQGHVSRLRGRLGELAPDDPPAILTEHRGYRADLDTHDLDADRFEALVARARDLRDDDPRQAASLLEDADAMWHGSAFGELGSHDAVRAEARRLERMRLSAAADHVDARLALGHHAEVVAELEATIERDPLDERATAQLMLALARTGRQADALATFDRLRTALRDELGVDPAPAVRDLHDRLLRQDPSVVDASSLRSTAPGPKPNELPTTPTADQPTPTSTPDRVARTSTPVAPATTSTGGEPATTSRPGEPATTPAPDEAPPATADTTDTPASPGTGRWEALPELLGRDDEVATLASWMATTRLVTLTGPGGVGKTRLAQRVAREVADAFADGVVEVLLSIVRDGADVGGAMITALGIQSSHEQSAEATLVDALGDRHLLLLLDNCEHLLDAVTPLVRTILSRCPNVAVLATSRELLHLPSERIWPVAPLAVPPEGADAAEVVASPAGALFAARADAVVPSFDLDDDTAPVVAELCRRLDGMPLAIELAAARTRALSPRDLVARLDERFAILGGGPRHEAGRHRTLEAVVAWSYDLLPSTEAALFDRLAVFAGPFTLEAAEAVGAGGAIERASVPGLLSELVDKSLVVVQRDEIVRYRLLDTLRDFGARKLADTGALETVRRAHADHHVALAEREGRRVRGSDERAAVAALEGAIGDLRSAHAWLVDSADLDGALRLPAALASYAFFRLRDEVTTWARRALSMAEARDHPAAPAALGGAAMGATSRDECERARREATEALDRAGGQDEVVVMATTALGTALMYEGDLAATLEVSDRLARAAARLDDHYHRAFAGVLRVLGHLYRGEQAAAVEQVARLRDVAEAAGNPTMQAFARYCHGEAHLDVDPDAAATSLARASELASTVDNRLIEGVSLVSLASLQARRGETDDALAVFREVVALWRRLGDHTHQLTTLRNLVGVLADVGADVAAAELYGYVTAGATPSFGVEAERIRAAWQQVQRRLGQDAASAARRRGSRLDASRAPDRALQHLAELQDRRTGTGS